MVRYSLDVKKGTINPEKVVKCRGSNLRVHFKNTRETAMALKGMSLNRAQKYLNNVLAHKEAIPFRRYNGGPGRHAQAKIYGVSQCRWPEKSVRFLLDLLQNAQANAEGKELSPEKLVLDHVQVNRAPTHRRRTYRAHGRISSYMGSPCHVEMVLSVKEDGVRKHVSLGKKEKGVSKRAQNAARKEQSLVSSSQA